MTQSITPFEPTVYRAVPQLTTEGTLALASALVRAIPEPVPAPLERAAQRLRDRVRDAEDAMTTRQRELVPVDYSHEAALDTITDALWAMLRDRLKSWGAFARDELSLVREGLRGKKAATLRAAQDKAARAEDLHVRLFGAEGLAFVQWPYPEQAQRMASLLRLIDEDDLHGDIEQLAGPAVLVALRRCQELYEAMVEQRVRREHPPSTDLGQHRRSLQRAITRYASAALTLVDDDEPASQQQVRDALRPIETFRARQARVRARASTEKNAPTADDDDDGTVDPAPGTTVAAE